VRRRQDRRRAHVALVLALFVSGALPLRAQNVAPARDTVTPRDSAVARDSSTDRSSAASGNSVTATTAQPPARRSVGGLPPHIPMNPMATSRSGLYAPPYRDPTRGWDQHVTFEYASAVETEFGQDGTERYLLDAELMRLQLAVSHGVWANEFVRAQWGVLGSYAGFADPALNWFHQRLGIYMRDRANRPINVYGDTLIVRDGTTITPPARALYLDGLRLELGHRYLDGLQGLISITLPTGNGPTGYRRGTPSFNLIHTLRVDDSSHVAWEFTGALGYTPRAGELSEVENTFFGSGTLGVRIRYHGGQSVYGNVWIHSPRYHDTGLNSLDRVETTLDAGLIFRSKSGHEFHLGLTENPVVEDLGLDIVLLFGYRW